MNFLEETVETGDKVKVRVPREFIQEMEELVEVLNVAYKKLMSVATRFNDFSEVNELAREETHEDDLKVIQSLEDAVDNFRSL